MLSPGETSQADLNFVVLGFMDHMPSWVVLCLPSAAFELNSAALNNAFADPISIISGQHELVSSVYPIFCEWSDGFVLYTSLAFQRTIGLCTYLLGNSDFSGDLYYSVFFTCRP